MTSIIILEDNIELLRLYGKVLVKAGHEIELVSDLHEAEQRLNTVQYQ